MCTAGKNTCDFSKVLLLQNGIKDMVRSFDTFPSLREKVSKYGVFCGPYFSVLSPNTGKHEPRKTLY